MDAIIDTGRLILRRFVAGDVDALYELCSRPEIVRYAQGGPIASREAARALLESGPLDDYRTRGYGRFACVWKPTGAVIGFSGIKFVVEVDENELGYRFLPEFWGRGLATEAGHASIRFARDHLRLSRLVALIHPENTASMRVVDKLGFAPEKAVRLAMLPGVDVRMYARSLEPAGTAPGEPDYSHAQPSSPARRFRSRQ